MSRKTGKNPMTKEEYLNRIMTISEMLEVINKEVGRVVVKDGGKKILAHPYKFIHEGDGYVLYRNAEKIGMTEVFRTTDEDKACRIFLKELRAL